MELDAGNRKVARRGLAHEAPGAVGRGPGGAPAAVPSGWLGRAVVEADERAERRGIVDLARRERGLGHGSFLMATVPEHGSAEDRHSSSTLLLLWPAQHWARRSCHSTSLHARCILARHGATGDVSP